MIKIKTVILNTIMIDLGLKSSNVVTKIISKHAEKKGVKMDHKKVLIEFLA